ncbi:MAG: alpha/beta hydrolase [Myxococcaceae bacterium]|jgi:pimeloyl-ACP methyl ester carboxylesterase|nr:alpha/beta hydrolase [Myxococcaceae bacterium]
MHERLEVWRRGGRFVDVDGTRLFVRAGGRGPVVLALHGYPLGSFDFSPVWSLLAESFTLVAPDLPGLGFSAKPLSPEATIPGLTTLVERLVLRLGYGEVRVLAVDLGTALAQELLARQLDGSTGLRVRAVCFLNGSLFPEVYRPRPIQRVLASPAGALLGPWVPRSAFTRALSSVFGPRTQPSPDDLECFWQLHRFDGGARSTHALNRLIFSRRVHRDRWVPAMQRASVPLRLVNGPADPNSGRHLMDRYRELIPSPDIVEVGPAIGHFPFFEAPHASAEAVATFFSRR